MKLYACYHILFEWDHWFIVTINKKNLQKLLNEQDFNMGLYIHGMRMYNVEEIIRGMASQKDPTDTVSYTHLTLPTILRV